MTSLRLAWSATDWSSSRFSRRSTDHTCQPSASLTRALANGAMYADPAEVPGLKTRMFGAWSGPIWSTPTLLKRFGVSGAR